MKKIITLTLLAVCLAAQADTLEQDNAAGGKIVLTDRPCGRPNASLLLEAYTYEADGTMGTGCWTFMDNLVHIAWDGGRRSVFPPIAFKRKATPSQSSPASPIK